MVIGGGCDLNKYLIIHILAHVPRPEPLAFASLFKFGSLVYFVVKFREYFAEPVYPIVKR